MKTVSLVLGSGGARGLAHIGVIRWLEQNGYQIRSISGASSGALVGGIYAAGELEAFEAWVRSIERKDIFSLLDFAWKRGGLVKGEKLIGAIQEMVGTRNIEDLPVKYTAVAVNLAREKEVWINSGDLFEAIRASVSIPLMFTPVRKGDALMVDGGVLNPVPITPTFGDNTDLTIAVNLDAELPYERPERLPARKVEETDRFRKALGRFNDRLFESVIREDRTEDSFFSVAMRAFETMQGTIARHKIAAYPPDHLIEISRRASKTLEIDRADEMIDLGYRKAAEVLGNQD